MSDLSECCYGMGFGPEGDGVELRYRARQAEARDHYDRSVLTDSEPDAIVSSAYAGPVIEGRNAFTVHVAADYSVSREAMIEQARRWEHVLQWASNTSGPMTGYKFRDHGSFENIQWPQWLFDDKPESNAKPSLPALTRQAGEKYKGPLAFCHADD